MFDALITNSIVEKKLMPVKALIKSLVTVDRKQGSYPFSETIFQDFSRTQIDFSRSPNAQ